LGKIIFFTSVYFAVSMVSGSSTLPHGKVFLVVGRGFRYIGLWHRLWLKVLGKEYNIFIVWGFTEFLSFF